MNDERHEYEPRHDGAASGFWMMIERGLVLFIKSFNDNGNGRQIIGSILPHGRGHCGCHLVTICMLCKGQGHSIGICLVKMKAGYTSNSGRHLNEKHGDKMREIEAAEDAEKR